MKDRYFSTKQLELGNNYFIYTLLKYIKGITFQKVLHRTPVVKNESHVAVFLQLVKR